jgi:hypothetical protein
MNNKNPDEVKLSVKDLHFIKSNSVQNWVQYSKGETDLVEAVIDAFIGFCNLNKLVVKDGKILKKLIKE